MTVSAVPYFTFNGNARQAMEFYHSIFGGDMRAVTFGEFQAVPAGDPAYEWVMHTAITGGVITLAASDYDPRLVPGNEPYVVGNHLSISLWGDDLEEGRGYFEKLSEGATVVMPFESQMWGDTYGQLIDRFGIEWSVNVGRNPAPA